MSGGMNDAFKTPQIPRDALATITNRASTSSSSSSASSARRGTKAPMRQTNLIDAFQVDSTASSSRSSGSNRDTVSSPCATSSSRVAHLSHVQEDNNDASRRGRDSSELLHEGPAIQIEEGTEGSKRRRIASNESTLEFCLGATRRLDSLFPPAQSQASVFASVNRRGIGLRVRGREISMRPGLQNLVSNNERGVFRCLSAQPYRAAAPPFACTFSNASKRGGKQVLAVSTEEGVINLINASEDSQWDRDHGRTSFQAHRNAIFDIEWSEDDRFIATASGDQSSRIMDVETQTCVGVLAGHTCTIKNVIWDPSQPNVLATASRDGAIRIWDRRTAAASDPDGSPGVATVNMIKNAHGTPKGSAVRRSAMKSVTAVAYLQQGNNLLASSGSSDGIIKIWDLRKAHSKRKNPAFVENNEESVSELSSVRPHGISSMVLSPNGQKLFALSTDSHVYTYDPNNLSSPAPLVTFRHPEASYGSFYIRLAVSPCSRYLATGSSDGGIYTWDVEGNGRDGVKLLGHEKEVGCVDWGHNVLASCSDDDLVRVWEYKPDIARRRSQKEIGWRWSGEDIAVAKSV